MRKVFLFPLFFLLTLNLFLATALCPDTDINLEKFPAGLAERLGITEFAGGILATILIAFIFMFPLAVYRKGFLITLMIGVCVFGFSVSIGWLPSWILILLTLMIAGMYAGKTRSWMT